MIRIRHCAGRVVLDVRAKAGQSHGVDASPEAAREHPEEFQRLLGLLVAQAYQDGMTAIRFEADPGSQTLTMGYFGPRDGKQPIWWDMTPPPGECYGAMIKAIVEATQFEAGVCASGTLQVYVNRQLVVVNVAIVDWYHVKLSW